MVLSCSTVVELAQYWYVPVLRRAPLVVCRVVVSTYIHTGTGVPVGGYRRLNLVHEKPSMSES